MVMVPVSSLRRALVVLEEKKYCNLQLGIVRDSILKQKEIINNNDTIISNQNKVISFLSENNKNYQKIILNKDTEIKYYQNLYYKEKRDKWIAIGGGTFIFLVAIFFL
jgi:hypothetical protein